ncbi:MAG TPA: fructosamine kinase family protein [Longimicrobiales bacterium]|nr:fructosamine kinase family protein [Longimicrobiales bacterium]
MSLPARVAAQVCRALEERGLGHRIDRTAGVGGGCINRGTRIESDTGITLFLKWNPAAPVGLFAAEADGLTALSRVGALRVPTPIAWSSNASGPSWLLLEYVSSATRTDDVEARLGAGLARLHASASERWYGWHADNFIGSLPQENAPAGSWGDFWRDRRIRPQLEGARARGHLREAAFDRLLDLVPRALQDVERPELLHGDLWGGNWLASGAGEPVLIDPAVYLGHGEVDLAMSELFGGFGPRFYEAYREVHPAADAYAAYRRDLYQLYYLAVHVRLFGASYEAGCLTAAKRVLAQLSG